MKSTLFSNGVAVFSLVTAGLALTTNANLRAHGHQHGDIFGRIMHKPKASSGSSLDITTLGAADSPVVAIPTATGIALGPGCFGGDCDPTNATHHSKPFTHQTPVPQLQLQASEVQGGQLASLPSRRRNRYRMLQTSGKDEAAPIIKLGPSSTGTMLAKTSDIVPAGISLLKASLKDQGDMKNGSDKEAEARSLPGFDAFRSHPDHKAIAPRQDNGYQSFVLGGFSNPTPTASSVALSATATSVCPAGNGTTYTSDAGIVYQIICNTDFPDDDYPFQLVDSFAGCVQKCDAYNYNAHHVQCVAALFIASRDEDANDCYLKSSIDDPTPTTLQIQGAIRIGYASSSAATSSSSTITSSSSSVSATTSASIVSSPGVTYASGDSVIAPKVAGTYLQGPSQNTPSSEYLDIEAPAGITLAKTLLTSGVNSDLSTDYPISPETGVLEFNISTQSYLSPLTDTPHLSRDGGKGGMLNDEHLFIFCDTGSYSPPTSTAEGNFLGFVSSSVAIDVGMNGLSGKALDLQDGIGEWSDNVGRMRGFAPLTTGEMAYNEALQGNGQRYAIWPESSIIPLDSTTAIIYAPIVYDNVNMATKAAVFTYTGSTLLTITVGGKGGPVAERTVDKIFDQDEVEWGCAGGLRSWGASGIGGDDGNVYLFGNVAGGLLVARTSATTVGDRDSFEYWGGRSWSSDMPSSSSTAYFIEGAFMDIDVFYSPRHLTFIIVYMTAYADSTFYYRHLEADQGILPPFAPGGDSSSDYVENILKYSWSEQQLLFKASPGLSGKYVYSGGAHLGYYGSKDIINGGTKMLLSWTSPTGLDPSTLTSEYQIVTAEVDFV